MVKYILSFVFIVLPFLGRAQSPTTCPPLPIASDFTLTTIEPICEGDGGLTVSCKKDLSQWHNVVYELRFPTGQKLQQAEPTFQSLSGHADEYVLVITGECPLPDPKTGNSKTEFQVEKRFRLPKGKRIPHRVTWVSTDSQPGGSRPSFIDNTQSPAVDLRLGKLVFNVVANVPLERIIFRIEEAPVPELVGKVDTWKRNGENYTLDGLYPAGKYKVYVHDGCSEIPVEFTLDALQSPIPARLGLDYDEPKNAAEKIAKGNDCNRFWLTTEFDTDHPTRVRYLRYRYDNLIEVALTPTGVEPTAYQDLLAEERIWWHDRHTRSIVRTAESYKDLYSKTLYDACIRVKGASSPTRLPIKMHNTPVFNDYAFRDRIWECGTYKMHPLWLSGGEMCYPWHYTVKEKETGHVVYENQQYYPDNQRTDWVTPLYPNKRYIFEAISADGVTVKDEYGDELRFLEDNLYKAHYMDGMYPTFRTNSHCGAKIVLRDKATNDILHEQSMTAATEKLTYKIEYNKDYVAEYVTADGVKLKELPVRHTLLLPEKFPFTVQWPSICYNNTTTPHVITNFAVNWQDLQYYQNRDYAFPVGTVITITSDAPNFEERSLTVPDKDVQYVSSPILPWPPGNYTATCDIGGTGTIKTYKFRFEGAQDLKKPLQFSVEKECGGWILSADWEFSTGNIYGASQGTCVVVEKANNNVGWGYYTYIERGKTVRIDKPGKYKVILSGNGSVHYWLSCPWQEIEFELVEDRPKLVPSKTLAFMCNEKHPEAAVMISVQGGKAPYLYELFKAENKQPKGDAIFTSSDIGALNQVLWDAPVYPEYLVRVTDACGERSTFEFHPKPVEKIPFAQVSAQNNCEGDPLQVYTYEIPGSTCEWTLPNGKKVEQHIIDIPETDAALHSGTYRLKLNLTRCGKTINASIDVNVTPRLKEVELLDVDACDHLPAIFSVTHKDGRPPYQYEWEEFLPNEGKWVGRGYHQAIYRSNALFRKPIGTTQTLRVTVKDGCGRKILSRAATATVRQCYVPVNPQLMHPVK